MKMNLSLLGALAVLLFFGCNKKDDPLPNPGNSAVTVKSTPQFAGTIDGTVVSYKAGVNDIINGLFSPTTISTSPNASTGVFGSGFLFYDVGLSDGIIIINKGTMTFDGSTADNAELKSFFAVGAHSYSKGAINGVEVTWHDQNGGQWTTSDGTGDQAGSSFNIDEIEEDGNLLKFKATFNCILYDGTGQSKTLTEGVFVGFLGDL